MKIFRKYLENNNKIKKKILLIYKMELQKYLYEKRTDGNIFKMLVDDLHNLKKFKNILLLRTPTTAPWMDSMLNNDPNINIVRIMYNIVKDNKYTKNSNYTYIEHDNIDDYLKSLNMKFDVICIDPYHGYKESNMDLKICSSYLSDDGILISHDCYPPKKEYATKEYKKGYWCGLTYICFIELAYNNPQWYYSIINNDNGIGIMSKNIISPLTINTIFDRKKQEELITIKENHTAYNYFIENKNNLINIIS